MSARKNVNIELLRVLSMLMILMLHYQNQGQVLELTVNTGSAAYCLVWTVEAICFISVNIYMLISGYLLSDKSYTWRRLISFYATIFFYSVVLSVICFSAGIAQFNTNNMISVFPIVGSRKNWYVTVYFAILLVSPVLNAAAYSLSKDRFKRILVVLFVLFSVFPTVFFWSDQFNLVSGYSVMWFGYQYLAGAYIKRYGLDIKPNHRIMMASSLILLPVSKLVIPAFFSTPILKNMGNTLYCYNSFPVFLAALAVFDSIINRERMIKSQTIEAFILHLGKTTFGVFFIHSFVLLRDKLWIGLGSKNFIGSPWSVAHGLVCAVLVFAVCGIIDGMRSYLFSHLGIDSYLKRLSGKIDGKYPL